MNQYDVIIVGAGPGGLAAARVLAKAGKKVILFEKNPVIGPKTCAGGLTVKDFELGIPKSLAENFFDKLTIVTPIANWEIAEKEPFVATVDRKKLGQYMQNKAEDAGAEIRVNSKVDKVTKDFVEAGGERYYFKHLIGADGSGSAIRSFLGLENNNMAAFHYKVSGNFEKIELHLDAKLFGSGYAWIFPHEGWASIGCGADTKTLIAADKLKMNFNSWLSDHKIDVTNSPYEAWMINYKYDGHEFGNIFLIGDAAGFASGLTGEGMYFAMISGIDVAKKIIDPEYKCENIKKILHVKKEHERLLSGMNLSVPLTQAEYDILGLLLKTKLLNRFFVKDLL